jgi:hypothetical protein
VLTKFSYVSGEEKNLCAELRPSFANIYFITYPLRNFMLVAKNLKLFEAARQTKQIFVTAKRIKTLNNEKICQSHEKAVETLTAFWKTLVQYIKELSQAP